MQGQFDIENIRQLISFHKSKRYDIYDVGVVQPELSPTKVLKAGQVGYFLSNMKTIGDAHIGDTFYQEGSQIEPFPGYDQPKPVVFAGIYPEDPDDYEELQKSLDVLRLNDASVSIQFEASAALGSGFRCGFLGMLHMDVFRQRLLEEHDIDVIITNPSGAYLCKTRGKDTGDINDDSTLIRVENPADSPKDELIQSWKEAICRATIITPKEFYKGIKVLCEDRRAICLNEDFMSGGKTVSLTYDIPTTEMITDFFDNLKSLSQGYASLDYEHNRF